MIDVISTCIDCFETNDLESILNKLDDDCLFINSKALPVLGKAKVIHYLEDIHKDYESFSMNILNTVKDSHDTILVSWAFRGIQQNKEISLFGTSVIRFNSEKKVKHIRSTTINA